jgi:hypothetical protein
MSRLSGDGYSIPGRNKYHVSNVGPLKPFLACQSARSSQSVGGARHTGFLAQRQVRHVREKREQKGSRKGSVLGLQHDTRIA